MVSSLGMSKGDDDQTALDTFGAAQVGSLPDGLDVQTFTLSILEGPEAGSSWTSQSDRTAIGSHGSNDLALTDRTVSRFHCEICLEPSGPVVIDLGSRNGTYVDGVRIKEAWLRDGSTLRIGKTALSFGLWGGRTAVPLHPADRFGTMVGQSVAMRAAFARMSRAALSEGTVLLEGETGTGKEEAAQSIHDASPRCDGPFVIVDCSSIQSNLLESELFGHERGAFTGAVAKRQGAIVAASGGTVFLDEIGELPAGLQPKVLRVLERRTVSPVGSHEQIAVDTRIIAATNRDLRAEVNLGRFRPDLYYRLAVLVVKLPPLRQRPDDIPLLIQHLLEKLGAGLEATTHVMAPENIARLQRGAWPGNVRELRNELERAMAFHDLDRRAYDPQIPASPSSLAEPPYLDPRISLTEARKLAIEDFERRYLVKLIKAHDGNVSQAARATEVSRVYLHRLLSRHGINR